MFQGHPVNSGTVMILAADGKTSSGEIHEDGSFEVSQLAVGSAKITVSHPNPDMRSPGPRNPEKVAPEIRERLARKEAERQSRKERGVQWFPIPTRYGTFITTDLTVTVEGRGITPCDLDLKP
jgi:hypothetical protein